MIAFEREMVWITLRDLDHGLGGRDLELARQLELLVQRCQARAAPARPLGRETQPDLDVLTARTVAAARALVAKLRETRPAEGSETPGPGAEAPVISQGSDGFENDSDSFTAALDPQCTGPTDPSESS